MHVFPDLNPCIGVDHVPNKRLKEAGDGTRELVKTVRTAATKKARTRNGLIGGSGGGGDFFFPPPPPPPAPSTSSASSSCCSNGSRSSHRLSFTPSEAALLLLTTLIPLANHSRLSTAGDGKLQSQAPIATECAHIASEEASTELLYPVDKIGHNEVLRQSAMRTGEEARGSLELLLRRRVCVFPLLYTWRSLICHEGPRTPQH